MAYNNLEDRDQLNDDYDDAESSDDNYPDREDLKACAGDLNCTSDYVLSWTESDAFRELFQNMKDDMIKRNGLGARDLKTTITESKNDLVVRFYARDVSTLLGFIKFNDKEGSLALVNFNAPLKRSCLKLGSSTKRDDTITAGCHGEGLKLAIIVFLRRRRKVRITASSHYWHFSLKRRDPRYRISLVKKASNLEAADRQKDELACSARDDVCIVISAARKGGRRVIIESVRK